VVPYAYEDLVREDARRAGYKIRAYFPDAGPYRRALYPKHMEFLRAGHAHRRGREHEAERRPQAADGVA